MWLHNARFYSRFFCVIDAVVGFAFSLWIRLWAGWPYVIWLVRFLVDSLPVGQDSQYAMLTDWHISQSALVWFGFAYAPERWMLERRWVLMPQVSSPCMLSLACHSTMHGEAQSYSEQLIKDITGGNSVPHQYSSGTLWTVLRTSICR